MRGRSDGGMETALSLLIDSASKCGEEEIDEERSRDQREGRDEKIRREGKKSNRK